MANAELKRLYTVLNDSAQLLDQQLHTTFLAAATEVGEDLLTGQVTTEDGLPDAATVAKLEAAFAKIDLSTYPPETIRQAWQLVLVQAIQKDGIAPNQQVTPDLMAELATFIATTFVNPVPETPRVGDLAAGSGNLLFGVLNQLRTAWARPVVGVAVDNDPALLAFADMSSQMQHLNVTLFHRDALAPVATEPLDVMVSDLPVGYYPVDARARTFETAAETGHSYAHHLLIERGMQLVKPGGLGLFFVPAQMFQTEEAAGLTAWLANTVHFQGLLNLPPELFADAAAQKALLILQNRGVGAAQVKQVLLGTFPAITDGAAVRAFFTNVTQWAQQNLK